MVKSKRFFLLCIPISVISLFYAIQNKGNSSDFCVRNFEQYAYYAPHNDIDNRDYPPSDSWQLVADMPLIQSPLAPYSVLKSRILDNQQEIWIGGYRGASRALYVYHVDSHEWDVIFKPIEKLFTPQDGTLWGQSPFHPFLYRFNELIRDFEPVDIVPDNRYSPKIILDENDVFWIFMSYDGIYRYNPVNNFEISERVITLPDYWIREAVLSPDGSIFYEIDSDKGKYTFSAPEGSLHQFTPQENVIVDLQLPSDPIPLFWGLLVDHLGQLWLGSSAYRDTNEVWHIIHPDAEWYMEYAYSGNLTYIWAPPEPILESSDGRLWFTRFADTRTVDGMAWYNPDTREGCQFTNYFSPSIVEDNLQQLWVVLDNKLYKYALNSTE